MSGRGGEEGGTWIVEAAGFAVEGIEPSRTGHPRARPWQQKQTVRWNRSRARTLSSRRSLFLLLGWFLAAGSAFTYVRTHVRTRRFTRGGLVSSPHSRLAQASSEGFAVNDRQGFPLHPRLPRSVPVYLSRWLIHGMPAPQKIANSGDVGHDAVAPRLLAVASSLLFSPLPFSPLLDSRSPPCCPIPSHPRRGSRALGLCPASRSHRR